MKKKNPEIVYSEPADYFPKELRKKFKLGEYAESKDNNASEEPENEDSDGKL